MTSSEPDLVRPGCSPLEVLGRESQSRRGVPAGAVTAGLVAATMLLAGCGSTVARHAGAAGVPGADGLGASGSNGMGSAPDPSSAGAVAGPGALGASDGSEAVAGGKTRAPATGAPNELAGTKGAGQATSPPAAGGPASTAPVELGFWVTSGDTTSSFGGNGSQSVGDERQQYQALVDDANASGGLGGRPIKGVYFQTRSGTTTLDQANQEACSFFTQDHRAFAVMSSLNSPNAVLRECLARRGVPLLRNYLADVGAAVMQRTPTYVLPSMLNLDRIAETQPGALHAARYFGTRTAVGVVTMDDPQFAHAVDRVLVPGLTRLGHQVKAVARFRVPEDADSIQAAGAAASSAVLQFRREGVTHVVFLSANGIPASVFLNAAESQQYRPRYAFTSQDAIQGIVSAGLVQNPREQLTSALGIGWVPSMDVPFSEQDEFNRRGATKRCLDVLAKRAQRPRSAQELLHATLNCDAFRFLAQALRGQPITTAGFVNGVGAIGRSFAPAATFSTRFGPDRRDGAATVRMYAFQDGCACFRYVARAEMST